MDSGPVVSINDLWEERRKHYFARIELEAYIADEIKLKNRIRELEEKVVKLEHLNSMATEFLSNF